MNKIFNFFLMEEKPFTKKRDVNWSKVKITVSILLTLIIFLILIIPSPPLEQTSFHEELQIGTIKEEAYDDLSKATSETIKQFKESELNAHHTQNSLDYLYSGNSAHSEGNQKNTETTSMIISREGTDSKNKLLSGTKFQLKLLTKVKLSSETMPVISVLENDVETEGSLALSAGSKFTGEAIFNETTERAEIVWKSILFPNGREKEINAVTVGSDGLMGLSGNIHSEKLKNSIGQTLTKFVGAYANGSMNKGNSGESSGGHINGLKNAISETASFRANEFGKDLQSEKKWIEIDSGTLISAVLKESFVFKEPGTIFGGSRQ